MSKREKKEKQPHEKMSPKEKKRTIITLSVVISLTVVIPLIVFCILINIPIEEREPEPDVAITETDAAEIARSEYGIDTLLWMGTGSDKRTGKDNYTYYIAGERQGELILVLVGSLKSVGHDARDWPFPLSFRDMAAALIAAGAETGSDAEGVGLAEYRLIGMEDKKAEVDEYAAQFGETDLHSRLKIGMIFTCSNADCKYMIAPVKENGGIMLKLYKKPTGQAAEVITLGE